MKWIGPWVVALVLLLSIPAVLGRYRIYGTAYQSTWAAQRQEYIKALQARPGLHLILVRYGRHGHEWIANDADIDKSKVVWGARRWGDLEDQKLLAYFRNREVWLLEPDAAPPRLTAIAR